MRLRIERKEGGEVRFIAIRRLKCPHCNRLHTELPDILVPYKHYSEEVISGVIDDIITPSDMNSESYPCETTMAHWKMWFKLNQVQIEGYLALIAFMRVNNAVPLCVAILCTIVYVLQKHSERFLKYLISGLPGMILITGSLLVWFASLGALYDMLYATFIFNFMYSSNAVFRIVLFDDKSVFLISLGFLAIGIVATVLSAIHKQYMYACFNFLSLLLILLSINLSGNCFTHYLMMGAPIFAFSIMLIFKHLPEKLLEKLDKVHSGIIVVAMLTLVISTGFKSEPIAVTINTLEIYKEDVYELAVVIPEDEQDEVFGYGVSSRFFYFSDIIPCYKYYTLQEWWAKSDPSILVEINEMLLNDSPKWIVLEDDKMNYANLEFIEIMNRYELVFYNDAGYLYRLAE